jgi:hypothetical protein
MREDPLRSEDEPAADQDDDGLESLDEPLYAERRSQFSPIAIGVLLLTLVVVVIVALTLL